MNLLNKLLGRPDAPVLDDEVEIRPITGLEVIKAFTTTDEPKLVDYPKGQYQAYWETVLGEVPGGFTAVVRFYGYRGSEHLNSEHIFTAPNIGALRPVVHQLIREKMETFKR